MPCTLPASLADAAVCRSSFHAVLGGEAGEAVFADFSAALQKAQAEGRILTASLFRYENHLFFYAEGLNRPFTPQGLCPALDAALLPWPPALGEAAPRPWAAMQPYFYHDVPTTAADWQQGRCPQRRRVEGDRWHLICVQEGVLFSYLEEPRTNVNIKHRPGAHSPELDAWIAADPESHFARFTPEQKAHPDSGHNFVFLPRIAGTED